MNLYLDTSALVKLYVAEEGSLLFCQRRIEPSSGLSIGTGGVPASASDRRFAAEDRHAPRVHRRRDAPGSPRSLTAARRRVTADKPVSRSLRASSAFPLFREARFLDRGSDDPAL